MRTLSILMAIFALGGTAPALAESQSHRRDPSDTRVDVDRTQSLNRRGVPDHRDFGRRDVSDRRDAFDRREAEDRRERRQELRERRLERRELRTERLQERFHSADANKDGAIDREEARRSFPRLHDSFDEIDRNRDKSLDEDEIRQFWQRRARERHIERLESDPRY